MKPIDEVKEYLLKHRINEHGDLDLRELDFSDFDGDVVISDMKVKKQLWQNGQFAEYIYQNSQQVKRDLYQGYQEVKGKIYQDNPKTLDVHGEDYDI